MRTFKFFAGLLLISVGLPFVAWSYVVRFQAVGAGNMDSMTAIVTLISVLVAGIGFWMIGDSQ